MVNSGYADVQREGLKILCRFAQIEQNGDMLVSADAIASVLGCLAKCKGDHEVRRVAGKTLCHFVKCYDLPAAIKQGNIPANKHGLFIVCWMLQLNDKSEERVGW